MSRANKAKGYVAEKQVGDFLGMKRLGATGESNEDLRKGDLLVEVKKGKQVPRLVVNAMAQVQQHVDDGQLGIVVVVPDGVGEKSIGTNAFAIMRLVDFKRFIFDDDAAESPVATQKQVSTVKIEFNDGTTTEVTLADPFA